MKINSDPLQIKDANFVEPVEVLMVEIYEDHIPKIEDMNMLDYPKKVKVVYPNAEEELINLLIQCKIERFEVMLCLKCSTVFEKEATKDLEGIRNRPSKKSFRDERIPQCAFKKRGFLIKTNQEPSNSWKS